VLGSCGKKPIDIYTSEIDMIKTLRITTVVAVILMGIFFVFSVVFGIRDDERIKRFPDSPGVIEKFENSADNKARISENQVSPLVQQAETFALYLKPKSETKKDRPVLRPTSVALGLDVTPKIKVFGTSYCVNNPEMSLALIDEPGKGWHWVRQSSKVGHLQIEQIKNGLVVVKSSNETFEIAIEPSPETSDQRQSFLPSVFGALPFIIGVFGSNVGILQPSSFVITGFEFGSSGKYLTRRTR